MIWRGAVKNSRIFDVSIEREDLRWGCVPDIEQIRRQPAIQMTLRFAMATIFDHPFTIATPSS